MRATELQDLLVTTLLRNCGGNRRGWRIAVGAVRVRDRATHAHCNWSITPSGRYREIAEIEKLLDDVRNSHPFVDEG